MKLRTTLAVTACAALLGGGLMRVVAREGSQAAPAGAAAVATRWEELVPRAWDPTKRFRELRLDTLNDADPRVQQLMQDMRAAWDNAPTQEHLDGKAARLAGYVVPLERAQGELQEFLLVPYFGACIHTPPPPANQIVHVKAGQPLPGLRMMDAVWVSGTLRTHRQSSAMGTSGYAIEGAALERYRPARQP